MTWQPIETAPKDGTHILLGRLGRPVLLSYWIGRGWFAGYGNDGFGPHALDEFGFPVTHWQPLPAPPEDAP